MGGGYTHCGIAFALRFIGLPDRGQRQQSAVLCVPISSLGIAKVITFNMKRTAAQGGGEWEEREEVEEKVRLWHVYHSLCHSLCLCRCLYVPA